jgi:hypothetical protein
MIEGKQLGNGPDGDHFAVCEHRDPVADCVQRVEIVRDQEHAEAQRVPEAPDQRVEGGGADRVEAGRRLVEEQQVRIERERARNAGALLHAAGQLGGIFGARILGQADHGQLVGRDLVHQLLVDAAVIFADRQLHVLGHGQRGEQGRALEQHAPAAADVARLADVGAQHVAPEHADLARLGLLQADDRTHQHRLAGAGAAHHAENLAAPQVDLEALVHDLVAEAILEAAHLNDVAALVRAFRARIGPVLGQLNCAHIHPIELKKTANTASSTMTRKIACTTAAVVLKPTSSALFLTCIP